jgi:hypothetical protein
VQINRGEAKARRRMKTEFTGLTELEISEMNSENVLILSLTPRLCASGENDLK